MGKNIIKAILTTIMLIILVISASLLLVGIFFAPPWQGISQMQRSFNRNQEAIIIVRDYLLSRNEPSLRYNQQLRDENGAMRTREMRGYVDFTNEEARRAMDLLLRRGFQSIAKEDNFIIFERWSRGDVSIGVMYSANRSLPDVHTLPRVPVTTLEHLSEEGWFYYELDYRELMRGVRDEGRRLD